MYQSAGLIHGDEIQADNLTVVDLDMDYFKEFFEDHIGEPLDKQDTPLPTILENMNLMKEGVLNISGALLFAKNPSSRLPVFIVKAISYPGTEVDVEHYIDS